MAEWNLAHRLAEITGLCKMISGTPGFLTATTTALRAPRTPAATKSAIESWGSLPQSWGVSGDRYGIGRSSLPAACPERVKSRLPRRKKKIVVAPCVRPPSRDHAPSKDPGQRDSLIPELPEGRAVVL